MQSALHQLEAIYNTTATSLHESEDERAARIAEEQERARRVAGMPPYQQAEYRCVECIALLRGALHNVSEAEESVARLDEGGDGAQNRADVVAQQQELLRGRQVARRAVQSLRTLEREVQRLAQGAGDAERMACKQVHVQAERARAWYREVMHINVVSSSASAATAEREPLLGQCFSNREEAEEAATTIEGLTGLEATVVVSHSAQEGLRQRRLTEDAEFDQFYTVLRQNDGLIDTALDRIAAGVYRLRDNALTIQDELQAQSALLDATEANVVQNTVALQGMNRRLHRALRELRASTLTTYLLCLLCLIGVLCVLLRFVGS